jgi:Sel1 repeat
MRKRFTCKSIHVCLLAALLGVTGCVTPNEPGDETRWQPQRLYLNRSPYPALYVEVAAVAGTEPSDAVLEQLRQFLTRYCDKPGGIRLVRDSLIPRSEARGFSHDALAQKCLQGPPADATNPSPAFIYILYYDSALCQLPGAGPRGPIHKHLSLQYDFGWTKTFQPHTHWMPFPAAIHMDRRYLKGLPGSLEGLILAHEAGHVLGLVQNKEHGFNNHCTNWKCLMAPKLLVDMPRALFSKQKTLQTNLCAMCQADLARDRMAAAPTNLSFLGPVLVRSERGYCVAVLPGELLLFSGEMDKSDAEAYLKESRENARRSETGGEVQFQTRWSLRLLDPPEDWARQMAALENAKTDRLEEVRMACTNLMPGAQCVVGQAYLKGDGAPKDLTKALQWFRKAAEAGNKEGQRELGHALAEGQGTPVDVVEAYQWLSVAAAKGDKAAQEELAVLTRKLSPDQLRQGRERAAVFARQSASQPALLK